MEQSRPSSKATSGRVWMGPFAIGPLRFSIRGRLGIIFRLSIGQTAPPMFIFCTRTLSFTKNVHYFLTKSYKPLARKPLRIRVTQIAVATLTSDWFLYKDRRTSNASRIVEHRLLSEATLPGSRGHRRRTPRRTRGVFTGRTEKRGQRGRGNNTDRSFHFFHHSVFFCKPFYTSLSLSFSPSLSFFGTFFLLYSRIFSFLLFPRSSFFLWISLFHAEGCPHGGAALLSVRAALASSDTSESLPPFQMPRVDRTNAGHTPLRISRALLWPCDPRTTRFFNFLIYFPCVRDLTPGEII